jgi:hypothetical protein
MPSGTDPEQGGGQPERHTGGSSPTKTRGQLTVIDTDSGKIVDTFKVGDASRGPSSLHPNGTLVYVTSEEGRRGYVVDVVGKKVVKPIKVGPRPAIDSRFCPMARARTCLLKTARRCRSSTRRKMATKSRPQAS